MNCDLMVVNEFISDPDFFLESAKAAGFGSFIPPSAAVGSGKYPGMSFMGRQAELVRRICEVVGQPILPNHMFYRVTNSQTETYIHSDRESGDYTCILYLSDHSAKSGTEFYRHNKLNSSSMPSMEEMQQLGVFNLVREDMERRTNFTCTDFVRGLRNRAVIFKAPLFHSRWPYDGLMNGQSEDRYVWVCHFNLPS